MRIGVVEKPHAQTRSAIDPIMLPRPPHSIQSRDGLSVQPPLRTPHSTALTDFSPVQKTEIVLHEFNDRSVHRRKVARLHRTLNILGCKRFGALGSGRPHSPIPARTVALNVPAPARPGHQLTAPVLRARRTIGPRSSRCAERTILPMIEHSAGHVRAVASEKLYPQNLKHARFIMSVKAYRPYGKLSRAKVVKMTRTPMKIAAVVIISAGIGLSPWVRPQQVRCRKSVRSRTPGVSKGPCSSRGASSAPWRRCCAY